MRYRPRRKPHGCSDRMCGAEDCQTCYPGRVFVDDEEYREEDRLTEADAEDERRHWEEMHKDDVDPPEPEMPTEEEMSDAEDAWSRMQEARYA